MHIDFNIVNKIIKGEERSDIVRKNIIYNFIIKGLSILVSFYMVRVTYDFLGDKEIYGLWLTILSVLTWISLFDFGLGNGLRYILTEALVLKDYYKAKVYVSNTYFIMSLIIFIMIIIFWACKSLINWYGIFNSKPNLQITDIINIIIVVYLLNFIFSIVNAVAYSYQNTIIPGTINLVTNLIIILVLAVICKLRYNNLFSLGIIFSMVTLLVNILANILLYKKAYKEVSPALTSIEIKKVSKVFNIGIKYFIIQFMGMIIYTTDNMIIIHIINSSAVVQYQISYKLFSIFSILAGLIMTPLWSAYTDAYTRRDYLWIEKTVKKVMSLMIPLIIGIIFMIAFSSFFIKLWMGQDFHISTKLNILMGIYVIINTWISVFTYFLNGINKINIQLAAVVFGGIINIPLSIYFAQNLKMGVSGVILGTILSIMLFALLAPIQTYYIFKKMKKTNV